MTRAPYVQLKAEAAYDRGPRELADTTLGWRFVNPRLAERHYPYSMGETAENVAERWGVTRERQDAFALESQQRAVAAIEAGRFADQIVPVAVPQRKGEPLVDRPRRASARRHDASRRWRGSGRPSARGRHGHGRQQLRHQRRRVGGPARRGGPGARARPQAAGPRRLDGRRRRRPGGHGHRARAGHAQGARARRDRASATSTSSSSTRRSPRSRSSCIDELGLDPGQGQRQRRRDRARPPARDERRPPRSRCSTHELRRTGGRYGLATMCIGVGQGIATIVERIED